MHACHVRRQHPALPCTLSRGSLECKSTSGGHRDRPSWVSTLVLLVTDPCLICWRRCSHPHGHHTLACRSTGKDELSRRRWSDTCFLLPSLALLLFPLSFRFFSSRFSLLMLFSPHAFLFRTYLSLVFISPGRLRGVPPQAHPAPLVHGYPCALKKGRASELMKDCR